MMPEQHWLQKVLIVSSQSDPHSLKLLMLCLRCPFLLHLKNVSITMLGKGIEVLNSKYNNK